MFGGNIAALEYEAVIDSDYSSLNTVPKTPEAWLGNNTCHTYLMTNVRAKYQVIHVLKGEVCGAKKLPVLIIIAIGNVLALIEAALK